MQQQLHKRGNKTTKAQHTSKQAQQNGGNSSVHSKMWVSMALWWMKLINMMLEWTHYAPYLYSWTLLESLYCSQLKIMLIYLMLRTLKQLVLIPFLLLSHLPLIVLFACDNQSLKGRYAGLPWS